MTDDYDAADDLSPSIAECSRATRGRIARGGPPWVPPVIEEEVSQCREMARGMGMPKEV